jgi:hypothetical protein
LDVFGPNISTVSFHTDHKLVENSLKILRP